MSSDAVRVIVRVRPTLKWEKESGKKEPCVRLGKKAPVVELRVSKQSRLRARYGVDACFGSDTTQEELYVNEVGGLTEKVFKGFDLTIFAYGMTGSGKTFTLTGGKSAAEEGIIYRIASELFEKKPASDCTVEMSYLEIYNDKVYDLLRPTTNDLPIREDVHAKKIFVAGLSSLSIDSEQAFRSLYAEGVRNRTTAATALNPDSSRSHAVLILSVACGTYHGKIHLIDLAGSEDNRRTGNTGIRLTESSSINSSLFVLGKVVHALNEKQLRIPFRDSKLTRMLQNSLGGTSHTVMIANIAPGVYCYHDTTNTLKFAAKSRKVINKPVQSIQTPNPPKQRKPSRRTLSNPARRRFRKLADKENVTITPLAKRRKDAAKSSLLTVASSSSSSSSSFSSSSSSAPSSSHRKQVKQRAYPFIYADDDEADDFLPSSSDEDDHIIVLDDEQASRRKPLGQLSTNSNTTDKDKQNAKLYKQKDKQKMEQLDADIEQKLLLILNESTEKELLQLHCIGKKRAELITLRRVRSPFSSLSDLEVVGLKDKSLHNFLTRNALKL